MDARRDSIAIRQRTGYLPGELNLWDKQTARQIIHFVGSARGGYDESYVRSLSERLEFDLSKKVRSYSTGNKRKLGLILALMNHPDLLILDEPSSGLDPLMQQTFYQLMREARAEGKTIFLSSHILSEVQAICDRVGILRGGRLQAVQRVSELTRADFRHVTLRLRDAAPSGLLANISGVSEVKTEGKQVQLQLAGDFDPLLRALNGNYVEDIEIQEPTLEEIFLKYYDGSDMRQKEAVS
jgi:ABC-2 type transport system ATP-binding protein